jgi:hypothetical protein
MRHVAVFRSTRRSAMSEGSLLVEADLSEARAHSKRVREELRQLEAALTALAADVAVKTEDSSPAVGRLERAKLNVSRALEELACTDALQSPF